MVATHASSLDGTNATTVLSASHALQPYTRRVTFFALLASAIILAFALPRIDFHADEAIYLHGVPINLSNDSGLVFHLTYLATALGVPTPTSTRWTSLMFGLVLIFAVTRTLQVLIPQRSRMLAVVVPMSIVISYQGVFSILRVRPEISWITVTSVCCWCLAELNAKDRLSFRILLIMALTALPMNHMLSWFSCLFLAIYLVAFASKRLGIAMTLGCLAAMGSGVLLNSIVRSWIVQGDIAWFPTLGSPGGAAKPKLREFIWNVFWNSPNFLNDSAANGNLWSTLFPVSISPAISHCLVATTLWACVLPLPLLMRTWESRYVASIPALTLGLFYGSGYFNPTYAPLLVLYGVLLSLFLAFTLEKGRLAKVGRGYAFVLLLVSVLNGSSFLTTRIFDHGSATFFEVESLIRSEVATMPKGSVIAVAERFQSVVQNKEVKKYILFKDELPENVDLVVLDHYDFDMYRFVPDYEPKRAAIEKLLATTPSKSELDRQVYKRERLRQDVKENQSIAALQGSWFFRNSVAYRVSLLRPSKQPLMTAEGFPSQPISDPIQR